MPLSRGYSILYTHFLMPYRDGFHAYGFGVRLWQTDLPPQPIIQQPSWRINGP